MELGRIKRTGGTGYGLQGPSPSGSKAGGSFQQSMGQQLREDYKARIFSLFDELSAEADHPPEHLDLSKLEHYRRLIGELLREMMEHVYRTQPERVADRTGKMRFFSAIQVVDENLESLCRDLLSRNMSRIEFLSGIDEIRGLVLDLLF